MLLCDFKKRKHFALTGFMRNNKKRHQLEKYIYNVPELTDPLIFLIKSCPRHPFSLFLLALIVLIVSLWIDGIFFRWRTIDKTVPLFADSQALYDLRSLAHNWMVGVGSYFWKGDLSFRVLRDKSTNECKLAFLLLLFCTPLYRCWEVLFSFSRHVYKTHTDYKISNQVIHTC